MASWFKDNLPFPFLKRDAVDASDTSKSQTATDGSDASNVSGKLVKISDLPIYPEKQSDITEYRFVEDDPILLQTFMHKYRVAIQNAYGGFTEQFGSAQRAVDAVQSAAKSTYDFVQSEGTVIPKAIAITIGGMAGFSFALRRGGVIKRVFYSGLGMSVVAAFCYPHETLDIVRSAGSFGQQRAQQAWRQFQEPPPPPSAQQSAKETGKQSEQLKDRDLYTTRSS